MQPIHVLSSYFHKINYNTVLPNIHVYLRSIVRAGADKSLARPGRKHATATKLGIYSTHSTRSSIHFLARCSNFCKPLKKKKFRTLSVQRGLRGSNDLPVGRKMETFQLFFRSRRVASARWVGALSYKNNTPLITFPRRSSFKMSFNCTSRDE